MLMRHWLFVVAAVFFVSSSSALAQRQSPAALREKVDVQADVEYGKAGERSLKLDVIRPKEAREKPRACIVWIHGGGWQNGRLPSTTLPITTASSSHLLKISITSFSRPVRATISIRSCDSESIIS